ncbi:hypothetical protein PUNSTDRAFT_100437 [Punctularia strigosozonata HHB-11173 SS5]|uniref:uncharacterized protein n=1 Tax=Punctularia strigosozonata (strain HHB-11173) TaxID=741275 RepID=UPI0004416B7A|nr:uncharacterized protein PUNSTDRAFT_100437 [Punctularia strigosozonata HHB-11173 SS5]EIN10711.1 hypothetical protein PUNSTDRAFT_100437 [Punctularia strigosozonata HHB-11173 SS5]
MAVTRKRNANNTNASAKKSLASHDELQISEEEQWRLVNKTGILNQLPQDGSNRQLKDGGLAEEDETPLAEEIFNAIVLIIPFSFLLLMMDILAHRQYAKEATVGVLADRLIPGIPILSVFIFYTTRYKRYRLMQASLFVLSIFLGTRMIYVVNMASWRVVMQQGPPLTTMWVYCVVQLDLAPATLSLLVIGAWVKWTGMKLVL